MHSYSSMEGSRMKGEKFKEFLTLELRLIFSQDTKNICSCSQHLPQACILALFPYLAYMMADSLDLSGIVSILFAGMVCCTGFYPSCFDCEPPSFLPDYETLHCVTLVRVSTTHNNKLLFNVVQAIRNICVRLVLE